MAGGWRWMWAVMAVLAVAWWVVPREAAVDESVSAAAEPHARPSASEAARDHGRARNETRGEERPSGTLPGSSQLALEWPAEAERSADAGTPSASADLDPDDTATVAARHVGPSNGRLPQHAMLARALSAMLPEGSELLDVDCGIESCRIETRHRSQQQHDEFAVSFGAAPGGGTQGEGPQRERPTFESGGTERITDDGVIAVDYLAGLDALASGTPESPF